MKRAHLKHHKNNMSINKEYPNKIEPLFKSIFQKDREARLLIDPKDGRIIEANNKAFSIFGINPDEFIDKNIIDLIHLKQKELLLELIRVFSGKRDFFIFNLQIGSSEKRVFEVYPAKIDWDNKKLLCLTFYDISKTAQKQESFAQFEKGFRFLMDETSDIVFICDMEGNLLDANKKAIELSGTSSKEQLLQTNLFEDYFADKNERDKIIHNLHDSKVYKNQKIVFKDINQKSKTISLTTYAPDNENNSGAFFVIIARVMGDDTTPEEHITLHSYKMESVAQLAKGVAHEFNNILTGIIGFSEILEMQMRHDNRSKSYIDKILFSANRGVQLVKDLNIFSQRDRSIPVLIDINETIRQFKNGLKNILNHNIDIELSLSGDNLFVMADSGQMRMMFLNLFANAKDAMPDGGLITISTEIADIDSKFKETYGFGVPGRYVLISFRDRGSGIDKKYTDKIFDPFFTTKEVGKGTGLGLSIVYGIVKQHNGFITVDSGEWGTSFEIYLPYSVNFREFTDSEQLIMPSGGTETILIAEDNEVLRILFKDILEGFGYRVITSIDGAEAAEIIKNNNSISLVIINSEMSLTDGTKAYNLIKAVKPDVKVIFLNGNNLDLTSFSLPNEKDRRVLRKPFSATGILSSVRELIESKK